VIDCVRETLEDVDVGTLLETDDVVDIVVELSDVLEEPSTNSSSECALSRNIKDTVIEIECSGWGGDLREISEGSLEGLLDVTSFFLG
jgi:hypothetical protein